MNSIYSNVNDRQSFSSAGQPMDGKQHVSHNQRRRSDYYWHDLIPFIDDLLLSRRRINEVSDLDQEDQETFAMHCFEHDERDLESLFKMEDDVVSKLVILLKTKSTDSKIEFAESVANSMVKYYSREMNKIIQQRIQYFSEDDRVNDDYDGRYFDEQENVAWSYK